MVFTLTLVDAKTADSFEVQDSAKTLLVYTSDHQNTAVVQHGKAAQLRLACLDTSLALADERVTNWFENLAACLKQDCHFVMVLLDSEKNKLQRLYCAFIAVFNHYMTSFDLEKAFCDTGFSRKDERDRDPKIAFIGIYIKFLLRFKQPVSVANADADDDPTDDDCPSLEEEEEDSPRGAQPGLAALVAESMQRGGVLDTGGQTAKGTVPVTNTPMAGYR